MKTVFTSINRLSFATSKMFKTIFTVTSLMLLVQFSYAQGRYVWNGGAGAWNTPANWTPTRSIVNVADTIVFNDGGSYTVNTVPLAGNQTIAQLIVEGGTDVTLQGQANNRTLTITGAAGETNLFVEAGSKLSNTTATYLSIALTANGQKAEIAGEFNWYAGTATLPGTTFSGVLNLDGGTVTMSNVTYPSTFATGAIVNHTSGTFTGAVAGLSFEAGTIYNHKATTTSATLPVATWDVASDIYITGVTTAATYGLPAATSAALAASQAMGNVTIDCQGQTVTTTLLGSGQYYYEIKGNLTVKSTGTGAFRLKNSTSTTVPLLLTVNGLFKIEGGTMYGTQATGSTCTIVAKGGYHQTGGTMNLSTVALACNMNVASDFLVAGGTFTQTGTTPSSLSFIGQGTYNQTGGTLTNTYINYAVNGGAGDLTLLTDITLDSLRTFAVSGGAAASAGKLNLNGHDITFDNAGSFTVNNFGVVDFGTNVIKDNAGNTTFTLGSGGTLIIGSQDGITTSGAVGNVQVGGTRTFNAGGHYIYRGTNGQVTGNGLYGTISAGVTGSVTVDLTDGGALTLTNSPTWYTIGTGGTLRMVSGSLANAARFLNNATATLEYAGTTAQTTTDMEWPANTNPPNRVVINSPAGVTMHDAREIGVSSNGSLVMTEGILHTTSSNLVTVKSTNATGTSGGSTSSYVNGPLGWSRTGAAAGNIFNFPIGKSSYAPFSYSNGTAGLTTYVVEYFETAPAAAAGLGMASLGNSYWRMQRTVGAVDVLNSTVSLGQSGLQSSSRIAYSPDNSTTAYTSIGGYITGDSIASIPVTIGADNYYSIGEGGTLSGVETTYTTLTSIAQALLTMQVTDDVVFELPTTYSGEPAYPVVFNEFLEDGNGPYNVTIRPASGSSNFLTAGDPGTNTPLINFNGIDRLTIDGRPGSSGSSVWTFRNTRTANVVGTVFTFDFDANDNTLTYLDVQGQNSAAASGLIFFGNSGTMGNSGNTISDCDIHARTDVTGIPTNGIYSVGGSGKVNASNTVTRCRIYDNYVTNANGAGVWLSSYNSEWVISDNHFYQTTNRTGMGAYSRYGIYAYSSQAGCIDFTVSGNYIGGSQPNAGGSPMVLDGTTAQSFYGIYVGTSSASQNTLVFDNVIKNIAISQGTTTAATIAGIYANSYVRQIYGNTIGSLNGSSDFITVSTTGTSTSNRIYGIITSTGTDTIYNNNIGGFRMPITTGFTPFYGIYVGAATNALVDNNVIGDVVNAYSNTGAVLLRGIDMLSSGINTITNNTVYGLTSASGYTGAGASAIVIGISDQSSSGNTTANKRISGNIVHSLSNTHASANVQVTGIYVANSTTTSYKQPSIDGNFIHSLSLSTTNASAIITGIRINSGYGVCYNNMIRLGIDANGDAITNGLNIYGIDNASTSSNISLPHAILHNSVYIGGSGVGGSNNTYAFYRSVANVNPYFDIRNNIFINNRSNSGGTGNHYALGFVGSYVDRITLDNNLYNTTGTGGQLVEMPASTNYATLNDWQTNSGYDMASLYGNPQFVNTTGDAADVDLHINASLPAQVESGGVVIAGYDTDYDGDYRSNHASYSGTGTAPDIGADENDFMPIDLTPPVITYTNIPNQVVFTGPTLSATITDNDAVDVAVGGAPRIYYKRAGDANTFNGNTDATDGWKYVESTTGSSPFDLIIDYGKLYNGTGVVEGDEIQYFVVAQDIFASPNVAINSGTFTTEPADINLVSTNFPITGNINSYRINIFTGVVTVGTGGDYESLTNDGGLFEAVSSGALSGNTVAEIISDLTSETGTHSLREWGEVGGSGYTLTIRPDGDTERLISGTYSTTVVVDGGLIRFDGADRVIVDGRDPADMEAGGRHLRFRNLSNANQTGNATFNFVNDATHDTLRYIIIEGATPSSASGVVCISTGAGSGNGNIMIDNCHIRDWSHAEGLPSNGIYSVGSLGKLNNNITVSNNHIYNFFTPSYASAGIWLGNYNSQWTITGNHFYQSASRASAAAVERYGIYVASAQAGSTDYIISENYIGGSSENAGGSAWTITGTHAHKFTGIYVSIASSALNSEIYGNVIDNISYSASTTSTSALAGFSGITSAYAKKIYNNRVGSLSGSASITLNTAGSYAAQLYGINASTAVDTVYNNIIGGIRIPTVNGLQSFYGIYLGTTADALVDSNTIGDVKSDYNSTGVSVMRGIFSSSGIKTITNNTIYGLTSATSYIGAGASAAVIGIYDQSTSGSATANKRISGNIIHSLSNTHASANVQVTGIYVANSTTTSYKQPSIDGNFIHSLSLSTTNASAIITGIRINSGFGVYYNNMIRLGVDANGDAIITGNNIYGIDYATTSSNVGLPHAFLHNSIYIGGTDVGGTGKSYAFFRSANNGTVYANIRNNIFVNDRSNGVSGTGKHLAIGFYATYSSTYLTCDNNLFDVNGSGGEVAEMPLNTYHTTLNDWQTNSGYDMSSLFGDPHFIDATGGAGDVDLHINTVVPTQVESGGVVIAGYDTDYDGDFRQHHASYSGSGTKPDIGADEGDFGSLDITPPMISYTPIANQTTFTPPTLSASITDMSGVENTPGLLPRLYYRSSTDANTFSGNTSTDNGWKYVEANPGYPPYMFDIDYSILYGGSATAGAVIEYFVVAQDIVSTPNVGVNSATLNSSPTASTALTASDFPATGTINSYLINVLQGTVQVGIGKTYTSLTNNGGIFEAINNAGVFGDLTVEITSDLSGELGTHPLNEWSEIGVGNYTVTFVPDGSTLRTISGNYVGANTAVGGLFRIDGADRVIFDGRDQSNLSAGDRLLLFKNSNPNNSTNNSSFTVMGDANDLEFRNIIVEGASASASNGVFRIASDGTGDGNDYITINDCIIRDASGSYPIYGIYAAGAFNKVNDHINITDNEIYNFNGSAQNAAIYVGSYNSDYTITGNSIYEPTVGTTASNKYGIIIDAATGGGENFDISGNYIGGNAKNASGTWLVNATSADYRFVGISMSCAITGNSKVKENIIRNFDITTSSIFQTQGGIFSGIYASNGDALISENTIGGSTGNIKITSTSTTSFGFVYGIFHSGNADVTITDNTIGGYDISNSTSSAGIRQLVGIRATAGSGKTNEISGNTIGGENSPMVNSTGNTYNTTTAIFHAGIYVTGTPTAIIKNNNISYFSYDAEGKSTTGAFQVAGIYRASASAVNTIEGNIINNISSKSPYTGTIGNVGVAGIYTVSGSNPQSVSQNIIHSIKNTNTGSDAVGAYGIYYSGGTAATNTISRNLVHTIQSSTSGASDIAGIYVSTGSVTVSNNMIRLGIDSFGNSVTTQSMFQGIVKNNSSANNYYYYNSIYIGGNGVGSSAVNTYAFRRIATGNSDNVRNNIFFNARSNATTGGKHYGVHFNNSTTLTMSHNLIYANGTGGILGGVNTTDYNTMGTWSATGLGANSPSANPNFISPASAIPDLHLDAATGSPAESAAIIISGQEDDYDAVGVRTGYPQSASNGGGTAPDMGADENDVTPIDVTPPTFSYTNIPSQNTACANPTTTVQVTIIDGQAGISLSNDLPRMYFRRKTGAPTTSWSYLNSVEGVYVSGNANSSVWSFTLDYSVFSIIPAIGDEFEYYFVAQDIASTPNVGTSQSDGATPEHSDVATLVTPASFSFPASGFYVFGPGPLSGTVYIDPSSQAGDTAGENWFTSLTKAGGLFSAINTRGLAGDLDVVIRGASISEDGTSQLSQWSEFCGSDYHMTITPGSASVKTLSGSLSGMGLFGIFASRVTIDGRYGGSGRYLKFENTYASNGGSENSTFRFGNGVAAMANDTLRYVEVVGNTTRSAGAVVHLHKADGLVVDNNLLHGGSNWAMNIIRSDNSSGVTISDNEIYNFLGWSGGTGTRSYGILVPSGNGGDWTIAGNSIYNTGINGQNVQTALAFLPGASSNDNIISGNWIGGSSAQCGTGGGVSYWGNSLTSSCTEVQHKAIDINAGTVEIDSNNISNIYMSGCDYVGMVLVHIQGATVATITNNVFGTGADGQPDASKIIQVAGGGCTSCPAPGYIYGVWNQGTSSSTTTYDKNDFYYLFQSGAYWGGAVQCIVHQASGPAVVTKNRINGPQASGFGLVNSFGVRIAPTANTSDNIISENIIAGPYILGGVDWGADSNSSNFGIAVALGNRTISGKIEKNVIWDMRNGEIGGYGATEGIYVWTNNGGNGNWDINNNMITLKNNGVTSNSIGLYGIDVELNSTSTTNVNYNTVYLGGANGGKAYAGCDISSYGFLRLPNQSGTVSGGATTLKNNIFINSRTVAATGMAHVAVANYGFSNYSTGWNASDNNFFFTNNGSLNYIGIWGTTKYDYQGGSISGWQSATGKDANSHTATVTTGSSNFSTGYLNPDAVGKLFVNPLSDLHISDTDGESYKFVDGRGTPLVTVTDDIDGETRSASAPTIGADERNGCEAPVVTTAPANDSVCDGGNVQFTVVSSGQTPLTYQWQINTGSGWSNLSDGGVYSGVTTDELNITGATAGLNGYQYRVHIENACGSVDSNGATLTVDAAPSITAYSPVSKTNQVCNLSNTSFGVTASGSGLSYQWQISSNAGSTWGNVNNGGAYSGATSNTLYVSNTPANFHENLYKVIVSGTCAPPDTSDAMLLQVGDVDITTQPGVSATICEDSNGEISVIATGNSLQYLWQVDTGSGWNDLSNGGVYSGVATDELAITGATTAMDGYVYRVRISSVGCSPVYSNTTTLNVPALPSATIGGSTTICSGESTSITFNGTANAEITYTINGGSNQTVQLNGSGTATVNTGALYAQTTYALVSVDDGTCSAPASGSATVDVNALPTVSLSALNPTLCYGTGTSVLFTGGPSYGVVGYKLNLGSTLYIDLDANGEAEIITGLLYSSQLYTLVSVADDNCETLLSDLLTLTVMPEPNAEAGDAQEVNCSVTSVTLNGATATGGASYLWTTDGDGSFDDATLLHPEYTFGPTDEGTLHFTLTVIGAPGCGQSESFTEVTILEAVWYVDNDGDGYGDASGTPSCTGGVGYVDNNLDFCDNDSDLNPSTLWWVDNDGDSFGGYIHIVGDVGAGCDTSATIGVYNLVLLGNDCNDNNPNIHPNAFEICWNGIDDNCNGVQNEDCPVIAPPANDNPLSNNPGLNNANFIYPNCHQITGTTIGATINQATGTRDVWYQFSAISGGVSIEVNSSDMDVRVYLFDYNLNLLSSENLVSGLGKEILNYGNLTSGQTYRIAVASADASDGLFTLCVQKLKAPNCANDAEEWNLCSLYKSKATGATNTTFSFTAPDNTTTQTTIASSSVLLNTIVLGLRHNTTYTLNLTANYHLQDGLGNPEVIYVNASGSCVVPITNHQLVEVRADNRCESNIVHARNGRLWGSLMSSGSICGLTSYRIEFTPVVNCAGDNPNLSGVFSKPTNITQPYIDLNYAMNGLPAGLSGTGYWSVRWRPRFNGYEGTYGPAHVVAVQKTSSAMGLQQQPDGPMSGLVSGGMDAGIYPNPNNGEMVNLNVTGLTTSEVKVRITDAMGREVYSNSYVVDGTLSTIVNFSKPLAQGMYMVEFIEGSTVTTRRMMVAK